jgi:hypothetical protein
MAHQAQETFVAELDSGPLLVQKGAVFSDSHEVVKLDDGRGMLFKPLDVDNQPPPAKSGPAKAESAKTPVKAAGKAS